MFVALVPQADRQRCVRAHPRGHGSKERPRRFQQVAVRRQLPDGRQHDPQSARQDQVRGEGENDIVVFHHSGENRRAGRLGYAWSSQGTSGMLSHSGVENRCLVSMATLSTRAPHPETAPND